MSDARIFEVNPVWLPALTMIVVLGLVVVLVVWNVRRRRRSRGVS